MWIKTWEDKKKLKLCAHDENLMCALKKLQQYLNKTI